MNRKYMKPTEVYELAVDRYGEIVKYCSEIKSRLEKYPLGKIRVVKNKWGVQYYLRNDTRDKSGAYISKSDVQKIKCFLQKRYDERVYLMLCSEKSNIEKYLKGAKNIKNEIQSVYSDYPKEVRSYINPIDMSDEDFAADWLSLEYQRKAIGEEVPVYITNKGERVRSKSELNIANALEKRNIPYKYECPLFLTNGKIIYPDFTVLNIRKRKVLYWEHRGMMDDRDYARQSVQRIKLLNKEGVCIGENLIISEETQNSPLGTDEINKIIETWLM